MHHLPDPHPSTDDHYKSFSEVFGTDTSEQYRPSMKAKPRKEKTLPFYPSVQHVRNAEMMLLCEECEMWRLIYAKRKLKGTEREQLELSLDYMSFSCGAQLQDGDIPVHLKDVVYVRQMSCEDPIEKLLLCQVCGHLCLLWCFCRSLE